ncbi:glycoside hydrolase family 3 protein [Bowmanella dokdonensis]|uniref:Glycoside hydrolase family 3 C-terminal domain-containing protein n=1 Tax=Bowmanella dokdonensis TaxID=751969 RepID=A0A939INU3_9ALTE|nr:exo 1,3/1,4-beta-D-glucan glucohydrolase [Bowmanella dokdonensis]MBN7825210.1 glycoside hydrolase family 3 C-terminal domain-containing protein [Bowmanella dokdonensis]
MLLGALTSGCNNPNADPIEPASESSRVPDYWPQINPEIPANPVIEQRVGALLQNMTLEQKVAQIIQPEIRDITVEDMRRYGFGSYLNGGGAFPNNDKHASVEDWVNLAETMYQASVDDSLDGSAIPTMWGTDAVHGHNNVIGATLFPHNIGLGATNNPELIQQIAKATATEVAATGIDWIFAPTVAVTRDDRWGRTYEAYSEDPDIVRNYAYAIVRGLQGEGDDFLSQQRVISTVKHFVGDGGTQGGDDQGNNLATEEALFSIHAQGYVGGLTAGAQSVMASFNSWHGKKIHGSEYLLTDILKERMGFDGFVVGDWNGHGQVAGCSNESCPQAFNAGLDVFMVPTQAWKPLMENTLAQVKSGQIPLARLDDAVSRVLRVKLRAGLFDKPSPANRLLAANKSLIGHADHRAIARQAVRESLVLLKNKDQLLPLYPKLNVLVAGDGADNIGKQSGGWTVTWQGTGNTNADFPGGTSIYEGIKARVEAVEGKVELSIDGNFQNKPDVAIVVFGEEPYAEGVGDLANLEYQRGNKADLALLKKLKSQGIPVVSVFLSGRPLWVNPELNASDAFVAAWLPGSEGQGVADVLFSKPDGTINYDFTGKLSFSWPASPGQTLVNIGDEDYQPLLPYGFGLSYGQENVLGDNLNEEVQRTHDDLPPLVLFENSIKAPWQLQIGAVGATQIVTSSVQQVGPVSLRTLDRHIQEDARQLTFDGTEPGQVTIGASFPVDMRNYQEANAQLTLDVRVQQAFSGEVTLAMSCGPDCQSEASLRETLQLLPLNEWQTISVSLDCFDSQHLAQMYAPFVLTSSGEGQLSLANIRLLPHPQSPASVTCDSN